VPATHIVADGEHIAEIAARFGFDNFSPLWNHPKNAQLKALRKSPFILAPGDELFIPDRVQVAFLRATASSHDVQVNVDRMGLRVRFLDLENKPRKGAKVALSVDIPSSGAASSQNAQDLTTDGDGKISIEISKSASVTDIIIDELEFASGVKIGGLDPIDTKTGVAQRLTNLGYIVWPLEQDLDPEEAEKRRDYDLRSSVEEFRCDNKLVPVKPEHDDPAFQAKLLELHGS
jgi:N-acetylmuramoyl-L-alanine amidase